MSGLIGLGASIATAAARASRERLQDAGIGTTWNTPFAPPTQGPGAHSVNAQIEATRASAANGASDVADRTDFDNLQPHQYNVSTRSFAPPESFGGGFQGDSRGYSTDPDVTSRIHSEVLVDTAEQGVRNHRADSDPSIHHTLPRYQPTETPDIEIQNNEFTQRGETTTTEFRSKHSGEDAVPRIPLPDWIPGVHNEFNISPALDVNTELSITSDRETNTLQISGEITGDDFPATEVFITDSSGQSLFLATGKPPAIASPLINLPNKFGLPFDIPGIPTSVTINRDIADVDVTVNTDDDGNFVSVEKFGQTISIEDWNRQFETRDPGFIDPLEGVNAAALEVREGYGEIGREGREAIGEVASADGALDTARELIEGGAEIGREGAELVGEAVWEGAKSGASTGRDIAGKVADKVSFWN